MALHQDMKRLLIVLIPIAFLTIWIGVNFDLKPFLVYLSMIILALFFIIRPDLFGRAKRLMAIDSNWKADVVYGLISGGIFLFLTLNKTFALGIPEVLSLESTSIVLIVVGMAPVIEEVFFRFLAMGFLMKNMNLNFWIANIIQAIAFALFHVLVYGSLLGQTTLFVSAFVFAMIFGYIAYTRNSILPVMIGHAMINLGQLKLVLIG